jgi:short-subunit dehydrogenase
MKKIYVKFFLSIVFLFVVYQIIDMYKTPHIPNNTKVIIIGATSGIGKALAQTFLEHNCIVGATGRRTHLLSDLSKKHKDNFFTQKMDITQIEDAIKNFNTLIENMQGVDIVILNAGTGYQNPKLDLEKTLQTIAVNVTGFATIANTTFNYFAKQRHGHLVGISSIASLIGNSKTPSYSASKAFVNSYLKGLRYKVSRENLNITVTNIMPGFVDTAMCKADGKAFWVACPQTAAQQIYNAIAKKKETAYVTKRWIFIAWIIKLLPEFLHKQIF